MKKSVLHAKLMALHNRLTRPRKEVKEELARCEAGLEGERKLLYYLSEIEGSAKVLHDIRLPFSTGYTHFQMDTVVITQQVILILDAKHFSGHLVFDRLSRQLKRGNVTYDDPITQVLRYKQRLEQWLDANPYYSCGRSNPAKRPHRNHSSGCPRSFPYPLCAGNSRKSPRIPSG